MSSSENINEQTIKGNTNVHNEIRSKFTQKQIDSFIATGKSLASKTVLTMLQRNIIEIAGRKKLPEIQAQYYVDQIGKLMDCDVVGRVVLDMGNDLPASISGLCVCLSLVPKDYKTEISIPQNYVNDLLEKYALIKNAGMAFWNWFRQEYDKLVTEIKTFLEIDILCLCEDPTNTTVLFFDADVKDRAGIFCYYVDKKGNPFIKRK